MMNPAEFANIAAAEADFWWYRGMREIAYALLDPIAKQRRIHRVLEAGCGTGYNALDLMKRYNWQMQAMDLQPEGLSYARSMGLRGLSLGDVAKLPFAPESFDAVLSFDVIVHFPRGEEAAALAEAARVLRPGGLLFLRASALDLLRSNHSRFAHERQRFTRERLVRGVEQAGLRVTRCTYANTLLMPVALFKFRLWEPLFEKQAESGVRPVGAALNRLLQWPLEFESRWLRAGGNLPAGQSLILLGEKPL